MEFLRRSELNLPIHLTLFYLSAASLLFCFPPSASSFLGDRRWCEGKWFALPSRHHTLQLSLWSSSHCLDPPGLLPPPSLHCAHAPLTLLGLRRRQVWALALELCKLTKQSFYYIFFPHHRYHYICTTFPVSESLYCVVKDQAWAYKWFMYQCLQTNLCRCTSPHCRSAGRREQRGAAASGGPGPGPPSAGASCSERPGTGPGRGDDPAEERDAGRRRWRCWLPPKAPGLQGAACRRRRRASSMFDDLLLLLGDFYSLNSLNWIFI